MWESASIHIEQGDIITSKKGFLLGSDMTSEHYLVRKVEYLGENRFRVIGEKKSIDVSPMVSIGWMKMVSGSITDSGPRWMRRWIPMDDPTPYFRPNCPRCGEDGPFKNGKKMRYGKLRQRWKCTECGKEWDFWMRWLVRRASRYHFGKRIHRRVLRGNHHGIFPVVRKWFCEERESISRNSRPNSLRSSVIRLNEMVNRWLLWSVRNAEKRHSGLWM